MGRIWVWTLLIGLAAAPVAAQESPVTPPADPGVVPVVAAAPSQAASETDRTYQPITRRQRMAWMRESTWSIPSLGVSAAQAMWSTATNSPPEWHRTTSGFTRRFGDVVAATAISNAVEDGLGAAWGEDPRYERSHEKGILPRLRYATVRVVMAQRRDGHLAPAWARVTAYGASTVIENSWLPSPLQTPGETTVRVFDGFLARFAANLWTEFWPDVHKRLPPWVPR